MTMSVRDKLNDGKLGVVIGAAAIAVALFAVYFYTRPAVAPVDATQLYYSDDDGASYYKDSVYKFPPYDHGGKTAYQAMILDDNGHHFLGYLMRFTSQAHKMLEDKYSELKTAQLSEKKMQQEMLDYLHSPQITWQVEVKLPGPGNKWLPKSAIYTLPIKSLSGGLPDAIVNP
jgi:hypothetical protein